MANPSLKNGYISIAHELIEKLAKVSISGSEMRILWVVWRKTWGWSVGNRKKDWDKISLSQFEKETGMKRTNVSDAIKSLVVKRLLLKQENSYKFNQNHEEWVVVKRLPHNKVVVKSIRGSSQTTPKSSSQKHTHNRKIETITKERRKKRTEKFIIEAIKRPEKDSYGELKNVLLTLDEYALLVERMGEGNLRILIDELDVYIGSKGVEYRSHYATLISWAKRRVKEIISKKPLIAFS